MTVVGDGGMEKWFAEVTVCCAKEIRERDGKRKETDHGRWKGLFMQDQLLPSRPQERHNLPNASQSQHEPTRTPFLDESV